MSFQIGVCDFFGFVIIIITTTQNMLCLTGVVLGVNFAQGVMWDGIIWRRV